MIRQSIDTLEPGTLVASMVANPQHPVRPLLDRGYQLSDRVIKLLGRIGYRTLWAEVNGTEQISNPLPPDFSKLFRVTCEALGSIFAARRKGEAEEGLLLGLRKPVLAMWDALEPPYVFSPDSDLHADRDELVFHSGNVMHLCLLTAKVFFDDGELGDSLVASLGMGAALHDIGYCGISHELIEKEVWELSQREMETLEAHTVTGYRVLRSCIGAVGAGIAFCHHRHSDGTGYPRANSMTGVDLVNDDEIHDFSRIAAVADAYDEMVTRQEYLPIEALEELNRARSMQFVPEVLAAFNKVVPPFPVGTDVVLSSGSKGVIAGFTPENPFRPKVLLTHNVRGEIFRPGQQKIADLSLGSSGDIVEAGARNIEHLLPASLDGGWDE